MSTDKATSVQKLSHVDLDDPALKLIIKESVSETINQLKDLITTNEGGNPMRIAKSKQQLKIARSSSSDDVTQYLGLVRGATQHIRGQPILRDTDGRHVHMSIYCDICNEQILGARYKCVVCHDYDLCSNCKSVSDHPFEHPLLMLRRPLFDKSRITIKSEIYQHPTTSTKESNTIGLGDVCLKSKSKAGQIPRQKTTMLTRLQGSDSHHHRGIPIGSLSNPKNQFGISHTRKGLLANEQDKSKIGLIYNQTAYPPSCLRVYTSTLTGIHSGRLCHYKFSIKNDTSLPWKCLSLQSRSLFQTYLTIIKSIHIVDWSITDLVSPGEYADIELVYYLDNVDHVFSCKNSFQQEWILKSGQHYLADIQCIMLFEQPMSKKFCPDAQVVSTDPQPSTSSSLSTEETEYYNKYFWNWTLEGERVKQRSRSSSPHPIDVHLHERQGTSKFTPPGPTPTSTPAGAMSPKSIDLVATALDTTPGKSDQLSSESPQHPVQVHEEKELLICESTTTIAAQKCDKSSDSLTDPPIDLSKTGMGRTNSHDKSDNKSESFFFLQPEESITPATTKSKSSDSKVKLKKPVRSKADVVATIRRSLEAMNLNKGDPETSSLEDLSSDFVVVKLPSCFDLDVPFNMKKDEDQVRNAPSPSILDAVPWPKWDGPSINRASEGLVSTDTKSNNPPIEGLDSNSDHNETSETDRLSSYKETSEIDRIPSYIETSQSTLPDYSDTNSSINSSVRIPSPIILQPSPNSSLYPNLESFEIEANNQQPPPLPPKRKVTQSLYSFIATQGSDNESEASSCNQANVDGQCSAPKSSLLSKGIDNNLNENDTTNNEHMCEIQHTGDRLFVCQHCSKAFRFEGNLETHSCRTGSLRPSSTLKDNTGDNSNLQSDQEPTKLNHHEVQNQQPTNIVSTNEIPNDLTPDSPSTRKMLDNLSILSEMGFNNREINTYLLLEYNHDLDKVLLELIGERV